MSAVASPTRTTASKKVSSPPKVLETAEDLIGAMFMKISVHLKNAAFAEDDGGLNSGRSTVLLRTAASMAGAHGGLYWDGRPGEAQGNGYEIASLVIAALQVERDALCTYALNEIKAAELLLADIASDDEVLEGALRAYGTKAKVAPESATPQASAEWPRRVELAQRAILELQEWTKMMGPVAIKAMEDQCASEGGIYWPDISPTIFRRMKALLEAAFYTLETGESVGYSLETLQETING